jgi:SAM-dependent methyltransferase
MTSGEWDARYRDDARVRAWSETPNRLLVTEVRELRPGRALDLAAGMGRNAIWLAEQGWAVTAVDFSEVGLAHGREQALARGVEIDFVLADVVGYEPGRRAFDLVLVLYLQLPAGEMRAVLETAAAAVAPGGTFLLVGHDLLNMTEGVGGPSTPDVLYTPEDVVAALGDLRVLRAERVERDVPDEPRPAIDCVVRATRPAPA